MLSLFKKCSLFEDSFNHLPPSGRCVYHILEYSVTLIYTLLAEIPGVARDSR
jgi:hypothetical protein